jgi:hypothetical protein
MKQSTPFKSRTYGTGSSNLGANIAQGSNIASERYKNKVALKNQNDNNAELFSKIGKNFSKPGDRPRGAFNNLATGLAEGLEYGAKSKASTERKEDFSKYDKVMNYFQEVNDAAIEQNQWYERREGARKELMPQVLAYMDNVDRLDPQSQRIMAQDLLGQYGEAIGEDFKLSSIDGSNPFLMTIQSEKGQQLFDMRSMFAGDEAVQQSIAMKMPEYQIRLQQERQDKEREFQLKEKALNAKYPSPMSGQENAEPNQNIEINGQKFSAFTMDRMEKSAKSDYQKTVNKSISQIPINNDAIQTIKEMRKIFDQYPNIGRSFVNMLDTQDDNGFLTLLKKNNPFISDAEAAAMQMLKKYSADLNLSTVLSVPGKSATDLLKQAINAASPSGKLTKEAFDKVSDSWEKRAKENISLALAKAQGMQQGKMIIPYGYSENMENIENNVNTNTDAPWAGIWKEAS